jgi:hypothetical protein
VTPVADVAVDDGDHDGLPRVTEERVIVGVVPESTAAEPLNVVIAEE